MQNFNILASLCSRADWFEPYVIGNPEDRFSRDEVHIKHEGAHLSVIIIIGQLMKFWYLLTCQPRVTVTSCFVYTF